MLKRYKSSFLADDFESMSCRLWKITNEVSAQTVSIAVKYDKDKDDVRLFNKVLEDTQRLDPDPENKIMTLFDSVGPDGRNPTAGRPGS